MKWGQFDTEVRKLGHKIHYRPDVVFGIARGGIIPAAMLARILRVRSIYVAKVRHVGERRRVDGDTLPRVAGKKVLIVEDMLKTGKSLIAAKTYLEDKGAEVRTACLYTMPQSEIVPDFSLKRVPKLVVFPWE